MTPPPRTTIGNDILSPRLSKFASVATQLLRMMLPVSARASSSRSTMSSKRECSAHHDTDQFEAVRLRKDEWGSPRKWTAEVLPDRNELGIVRLCDKSKRPKPSN